MAQAIFAEEGPRLRARGGVQYLLVQGRPFGATWMLGGLTRWVGLGRYIRMLSGLAKSTGHPNRAAQRASL